MKLKKSLFIFISFFFCQIEILHAQNADINILRSINVHRNTSLDNPMKFISKSEGYIGIGIPIAILAVAYAREDSKLFQQGINMSLALIANTASTFVLKKIINRTRPSYTYSDIQAFENVQYHSFPSGHTSNAFCTAMSVSLNFKKASIIIPAFVWAGVVGYSRMHLGVHYPSDVLGGALVGIGSAYATYKINQWFKSYFKKKYPESHFLNF